MRVPGSDRVRRRLRDFRQSLLYYPTLLTAAAVGLAGLTGLADARLAEGGPRDGLLWGLLLFNGGPQPASQLLAALAGTWATIAGVVYSVTLVTIQLSATKYSAQVIPAFERDRFNQVVLGAFTGTFVYSLLVLGMVRNDPASVPVLGVNVAVVLAVLSLFLFVGFLGNLTSYMRPTRFVEDVVRRGLAETPLLREPQGVEGYRSLSPLPPLAPGAPHAELVAEEDGHVGHIDWVELRKVLSRLAKEGPLPERLRIAAAPGRHLEREDVLLTVVGPEARAKEVAQRLRPVVAMASVRSVHRDPTFAVDSLEDVALTAMSGGSTDVGLARVALHGLLRLATVDLAHPPPRATFVVHAGGAEVAIEREPERLAEQALTSATRVLEKAWREGYWVLGEETAQQLTKLAQAAAQAPEVEAWDLLLRWLRELAPRLLAAEERSARERLAESLVHAARGLREAGEDERARTLEDLVLEASQGTPAEETVRKALQGAQAHHAAKPLA